MCWSLKRLNVMMSINNRTKEGPSHFEMTFFSAIIHPLENGVIVENFWQRPRNDMVFQTYNLHTTF